MEASRRGRPRRRSRQGGRESLAAAVHLTGSLCSDVELLLVCDSNGIGEASECGLHAAALGCDRDRQRDGGAASRRVVDRGKTQGTEAIGSRWTTTRRRSTRRLDRGAALIAFPRSPPSPSAVPSRCP